MSLTRFVVVTGLALSAISLGCSSNNSAITADGTEKVQLAGHRISATTGTGELDYLIRQPGEVAVTESSSGNVLVTHPVKQGDLVVVDPQSDRILVNGEPISTVKLDVTREYSISFKPLPADTHSWGDGTYPVW